MQRIRRRIREKRGVDFTDEDIRQLAGVKLEQFLDPGAVRSDLVEQYQRRRPPVIFEPIAVPKVSTYTFDQDTIYRSSRGATGSLLAFIRRLMNPVLKLLFNPGPIIQALHHQSRINQELQEAVEASLEKLANAHQVQATHDQELDSLNFEIFNNLVVELTRLGIEVKNLRMQVESLSSRLDFDERRAQALEGVVQSRAGAPSLTAGAKTSPADTEATRESPSTRPKRRRRRGRRRSGSPATAEAAGSSTPTEGSPDTPAAAAPAGSSTPTGGSPDTPAAAAPAGSPTPTKGSPDTPAAAAPAGSPTPTGGSPDTSAAADSVTPSTGPSDARPSTHAPPGEPRPTRPAPAASLPQAIDPDPGSGDQ